MGMKAGQIFAAFATDKFDLTKNLSGIVFRREGAVVVLLVIGGHQHIFGDLDEIFGIAALGTGNPSGRFPGGDLYFFHKKRAIERTAANKTGP